MEVEVAAAIVTVGSSLLVSVGTGIWTASFKTQQQLHLKRMEELISQQSKEKGARRDYEYEARKRLYAEFEPMLLPLLEDGETAMHTVVSLARSARNGEILRDGKGWLNAPGYYLLSSVYRVLVPLARIMLLKRRLTFVDMRLDSAIARQYLLCKCLALSFTDDFELPRAGTVLEYDPHNSNADKLRKPKPALFAHQGVSFNVLDS